MSKMKIKDFNIARLLESLPTGLILIDKNKTIIEANPEAKKLLGKDIESKDIEKVFKNVDKSIFDKVFKGEHVERRVLELKKTLIGFSASPVFDHSGKNLGSSIILRDITEIREMEEELRRKDRLAALGEMVAGLAHEIRNPLASIKAGIESFSFEGSKSTNNYKFQSIVLHEIERLERIVNDMTMYASDKNLVKTKVNLKGLIGEILLMFGQEIAEKNIHVKKNLKGNLICYVDRDKIITVLNNLFLNAIDAIGKNGTIEFDIKRGKKNMLIQVKDDGGGIPQDIIEKLFIPFFTTKSKGTGLGLSIVSSIIQNHHGTIKVKNEGKGACFTITLPKE
jgi:two-component system, NtrC family, sensor histidine kinase HydH